MDGSLPAVVRRSFGEFLAIPTALFVAFGALAGTMLAVDRSGISAVATARDAITDLMLADPDASRLLLETIATSLITVTGITFSALLLTVQQSASSMTHAVFDQFLRRKLNQAVFGALIGLALYLLVVLSTVSQDFNPVLSATVGLVLTCGALYLLVLLIYIAVDQMRPAQIIELIHNEILSGHDHQLAALARTRRAGHSSSAGVVVRATTDGFVTRIDFDALAVAVADDPDGEVILCVSTGTYVALGQSIAEFNGRGVSPEVVRTAVRLEPVRDIRIDPCYGVEQLVNIAWTSLSTSKHDAAPGQLVILTLRDLFGRFETATAATNQTDVDLLAVVYNYGVATAMWDAIDSLGVVCSESMQSHSLAELIRSLSAVCHRLDPTDQCRVAPAAMRLLSGLGDHVLTASLESAMIELEETLRHNHRAEADRLRVARAQLASTVGTLNSRSTRVPNR